MTDEIKLNYIDKDLKKKLLEIMGRDKEHMKKEGKVKEADEIDMYMMLVEYADEPPED